MIKSKIIGMGYHTPERIVTNKELETYMDTSDDWIFSRSGIKERRWVENDTAVSDLALEASKNAIRAASISPKEIDLVIVGSISSDHYFPGVSAQLQHKLGLRKIAAFDIKVACSAFIYALSIGDQFIKTGMAQTILIVGAEVQSKFLDFSTEGREMAVLFGDGAGAAILQKTENDACILSTHLHCEGKNFKKLWMEAPGSAYDCQTHTVDFKEKKHFPSMNGREVFRNAIIRFPEVIKECLQANDLELEEIKLIVPHQANFRISKAVAKKMGIDMKKVYSNISKYGNTTGASIPIALCEALEEKCFSEGDIIILASFGAGFTWASAAIQW